jgi:hypothetical protein
MATAAEPGAERATQSESSGAKTTTRTRRARTGSEQKNNHVCARYFLAKANANGDAPALDKEVTSEGEALVEALRAGVTYYEVQEFRVVPDFSAKIPKLKKESVRKQ